MYHIVYRIVYRIKNWRVVQSVLPLHLSTNQSWFSLGKDAYRWRSSPCLAMVIMRHESFQHIE